MNVVVFPLGRHGAEANRIANDLAIHLFAGNRVAAERAWVVSCLQHRHKLEARGVPDQAIDAALRGLRDDVRDLLDAFHSPNSERERG